MVKKGLSVSAFRATAALCLGHALYYYPRLPDRVASHFGASGAPNGWMGKGVFVGFYVGLIALLGFLLAKTAGGLAGMADSRVNIPNKEYWLAPERREESLGFISRHFYWFGAATFALVLDFMHQAFRVNLGQAAGLERPFLSLGCYLVVTAAWIAGLYARFRRP